MVQIQFLTAAVGALCVALFLLPSLFGRGEDLQHALCFSPALVVTRLQVYRVFTAPFIHLGFFHILLNMIAWYFLSNEYESKVGSLTFFYNIFVVLMPICAVFHGVLAYVLDTVPSWHFKFECAAGISGILFALLVISLEYSETVSIFGFFDMPAKWYPLLLAVILELLSPGLSFLGHLSGIAVGYAFVAGTFNFAKLSNSTLTSIENKLSLRSLPYWVSTSGSGFYSSIGQSNSPSSPSGGGFSAWAGSVRENASGWFSSNTSEPQRPSPTAFAGSGFVVGGHRIDTSGSRTGVPPQSRLLTMPLPKKKETIVAVSEPKGETDIEAKTATPNENERDGQDAV